MFHLDSLKLEKEGGKTTSNLAPERKRAPQSTSLPRQAGGAARGWWCAPGTGRGSRDSQSAPGLATRRHERTSANTNESDLPAARPRRVSQCRIQREPDLWAAPTRSRNLITFPLFYCRCNQPLFITAANSRAPWRAVKGGAFRSAMFQRTLIYSPEPAPAHNHPSWATASRCVQTRMPGFPPSPATHRKVAEQGGVLCQDTRHGPVTATRGPPSMALHRHLRLSSEIPKSHRQFVATKSETFL